MAEVFFTGGEARYPPQRYIITITITLKVVKLTSLADGELISGVPVGKVALYTRVQGMTSGMSHNGRYSMSDDPQTNIRQDGTV